MTDERILFPNPLPVKRLLEFHDLDLTVIGSEEGLKRGIVRPEVNRPALELTGFFEKYQPDRVQIFGSGEMSYLQSHLDNQTVLQNLDRLFATPPPCVVITNDYDVFPEIIKAANQNNVSVLKTTFNTTIFTKRLWDHLEIDLSPYVVRRGVLMDVFNIGTLITGPSSIGKSECALELLSKDHAFVADDLILIRGTQLSRLVGMGRSPVPYHMEIRGIGIIDISRMYGPKSVRMSKQVDLIVKLEDWDPSKEYERLGIEDKTTSILGIEKPCYTIPVKPGRNIATIVEVAVLDYKLKESGVHMAKEFDEKLIGSMKKHEDR